MTDIASSILWPREQDRYAGQAAVDRFLDGHTVRIVSTLGDFQIPENPTWSEDPFDSRSWALYYNSLGWLYAGEQAYKQGKMDDFPLYAKNIIMDFLADNSDVDNPTHVLVWHDGGNAFRLSNLAYFYENYFKDGNPNHTGITFTPEETALFQLGLQNHLEQDLWQLSRLDKWEESNHRFFHAMALASYATVFGKETDSTSPFFVPNAASYLDQALTILDEILHSIINVDAGVTTEQSFTYQRLDMGLALEAIESVENAGYTLGATDYKEVVERMVEFDVMTRRPGTAVAEDYISEVGDTAYGTRAGSMYIDDAIKMGLVSDKADYVLSHGAHGVRPADLIDYSAAGYIVLRPEYAWENARDTRVLFDVSEHRISHGHYDNTNVLLSAYGERILVDSGGPYSYDKKNDLGYGDSLRRVYFETSEAHNVLVVDGQSFDADTRVEVMQDNELFSFVRAAHDGYTDIDVSRGLLLLKDAGVVVLFDDAQNASATEHEYELNFHFDPKILGLEAGAYTDFSVGDVQVDAAFASGADTAREIVAGRAGEDPQGWVTRALYTIEPAPVLEMTQHGEDAWFVSAFGSAQDSVYRLELTTTKTADGFTAHVGFRGLVWDITIDATGAHVTQTGKLITDGEISGTEGADILKGTDEANAIYALGGDDKIFGKAGKDTIYGGNGNDSIDAGDDHDRVEGGAGKDMLKGGLGIDTLLGGEGDDKIYGGDNSDRIDGGADNDILDGEKGNDTIEGGTGNDKIFGDNGLDSITAGDGNDTVHGDRDNDSIHGGAGNDRLYGDLGNDTLAGGAGDDIVYGGEGDDIFLMDAGTDRYFGELGVDVAVFTGNSSDYHYYTRDTYVKVIDLNMSDGDQGIELLYGFETLRFHDGDVALV